MSEITNNSTVDLPVLSGDGVKEFFQSGKITSCDSNGKIMDSGQQGMSLSSKLKSKMEMNNTKGLSVTKSKTHITGNAASPSKDGHQSSIIRESLYDFRFDKSKKNKRICVEASGCKENKIRKASEGEDAGTHGHDMDITSKEDEETGSLNTSTVRNPAVVPGCSYKSDHKLSSHPSDIDIGAPGGDKGDRSDMDRTPGDMTVPPGGTRENVANSSVLADGSANLSKDRQECTQNSQSQSDSSGAPPVDNSPGRSDDVPPGCSCDLPPGDRRNVPPGGSDDVPPGGSDDVPPEGSGNVHPEGSDDTPPGGSDDAPPGGFGNVHPEGSDDAPPVSSGDVPLGGSGDAPPGSSGDVPPGSSGDVPPEGTSNHTGGVVRLDRKTDNGDPLYVNSVGMTFGMNLSDEALDYIRDLVEQAKNGKPPTASKVKYLTIHSLEQLVKFNDRPLYQLGTHPELAATVADYIKNGVPPRCPKCKRGALRFSNGKKKYGKKYYWCPGYSPNGFHFYGCNFKAPREEIARIPFAYPE